MSAEQADHFDHVKARSNSDQGGPATLAEALYDVLLGEERGDFGAKPARAAVAAALVAEAEKYEGDQVRRLRAENEALRLGQQHEGLKASPWCTAVGGARAWCADCDVLLAEHPDPAICESFGLVHVRESGHRVEIERRQVRDIQPETRPASDEQGASESAGHSLTDCRIEPGALPSPRTNVTKEDPS